MTPYQVSIQKILSLPWNTFHPLNITYLSLVTSREFGESLRMAQKVFPEHAGVQKLASEELDTTNLSFGDFSQKGDHYDFLNYFFKKENLVRKVSVGVVEIGSDYTHRINSQFTEVERAMTVFSRESELPYIFLKIKHAHLWSKYGLDFYLKYLSTHIQWDGGDNGHNAMVKDILLEESALNRFWYLRHSMYSQLI